MSSYIRHRDPKIPPTKIPPTKIPPSENSTQRKFHSAKIRLGIHHPSIYCWVEFSLGGIFVGGIFLEPSAIPFRIIIIILSVFNYRLIVCGHTTCNTDKFFFLHLSIAGLAWVCTRVYIYPFNPLGWIFSVKKNVFFFC